MLYGTMLGLLGAAVLGTVAAKYFGLSNLSELRPTPNPEASALGRWLQPYKERLQVYTRPATSEVQTVSAADKVSAKESVIRDMSSKRINAPGSASSSDFAHRLAARYNPQYSRPNSSANQRASAVL